MFILLLVCGVVYVLLGDKAEAGMLLGFVAVVVGISVSQAEKAERTLDALRELSAAQAIVVRSGRQIRIPARDVVRGDVVVLAEGDRVPADAVMISGTNVSVDESLLTGESVAVRKAVATQLATDMGKPGGDDLPFVFSGTLLVQGRGIARVLAIGQETQFGKIGGALSSVRAEPARVQVETNRVVRRLAIAAVLTSVLVTVAYGYGRGDWLHALLVGIALAMAILPEELPVVLSVFFGLGAWRMAQNLVLTRYLPAIEMLGSATVLCVDKTGTLTENRMSVSALCRPDGRLWNDDGVKALPDDFHEILEFGTLASHRDPFDPTERAIADALERKLAGTEHVHRDWALVSEYPLSRTMLAMSRVWSSSLTRQWVIAAKGAPEAIADLCHLSEPEIAALTNSVRSLADSGLRVLGVARAYLPAERLPESQHDFDFDFVGLIGLADPIRETVPAAVTEAYAAGVRVIMVTGDYPETAMHVARGIGLRDADRYITGSQLEAMTDAELSRRIETTSIFCRVVPEQKLRLVTALKSDGEIVAMTGDGVNDAPALKAAHVGIAMGGRGTDVAREAAALVLLNDDFGSIIEAIRLGRRIFDNIHKAISFVTAAHVPIVGMAVIPILLGLPLLLLPIHILFLQLIIDPACSIAFEAEPADPDVMRRPPRPVKESLFAPRLVITSIFQGAVILAVVLAVFWVTLQGGRDEGSARAMAFSIMLVAGLALLFVNRTAGAGLHETIHVSNRALLIISVGALAFLALAALAPPVRALFAFDALLPKDLAVIGGAWLICIVALAALKRLSRRIANCSREAIST
ncbi:MAG TPA: cation-translocating P-type ATPase [Candidatus Tumulicola sp.]|nr:cation-translocating P-type ATPase [Candidatus Tumulicola sp.]